MADTLDLRSSVLGAWRTNCRVTSYLVEELPAALWGEAIPGVAPRRTVRMLSRTCTIEALLMLGLEADNQVPPSPTYTWRNLPLDVGHVLT